MDIAFTLYRKELGHHLYCVAIMVQEKSLFVGCEVRLALWNIQKNERSSRYMNWSKDHLLMPGVNVLEFALPRIRVQYRHVQIKIHLSTWVLEIEPPSTWENMCKTQIPAPPLAVETDHAKKRSIDLDLDRGKKIDAKLRRFNHDDRNANSLPQTV